VIGRLEHRREIIDKRSRPIQNHVAGFHEARLPYLT
jgi:hypothetical protein